MIIITGGNGFLGHNLSKKFLEKNHEVVIIDSKKNNSSAAKFIRCDLTDERSLNKIKIKKKNIILHCAGQPSAAKSFEDPILDLKVNILGTLNILKWAKKNNTTKIIYASTFNVYEENIKNFKLKETSPCKSKSLYSVSKKAAEDYIINYGSYIGLRWNILRMFNIYGPGQDPKNKFLGMISIFLNMARSNKKIFIKGSLDRFRDFIYIDDVVEAWYKVALSEKNYNKVYNLGTGKKTYIKDLLKKIIKITKSTSTIKQLDATPGDFKGCYADVNNLKKDFNFQSKTNLNLGIKNFNKWLDSI
jgi:UDP-glucose 4-epimerase